VLAESEVESLRRAKVGVISGVGRPAKFMVTLPFEDLLYEMLLFRGLRSSSMFDMELDIEFSNFSRARFKMGRLEGEMIETRLD
jgi:hypothetical protein